MESPHTILIRSLLHDTTIVAGRKRTDPGGWHRTFSFKSEEQVSQGVHITSHGYTAGKESYNLTIASPTPAKEDTTLKRHNQQPVWPPENELRDTPLMISAAL